MRWAIEEVLLPGQINVRDTINERAAAGLQLEKTGFMKVELTWELHGKEGEPLHFFLEKGTKPHIIKPKKAD